MTADGLVNKDRNEKGEKMGTSGIVSFREKWGENKPSLLVNVYHHYDGYLEGVGRDLCKWLSGKIITNGFSADDNRDIANGAGCLAAQYIKDQKKGVGNLYIYPSKVNLKHYDYSYIVTIEAGGGFEDKKAEDVITITVKRFGRKIFTGTLPEFMLLCMHD